ncbi:uncharacterized protein LOC131212611 [Anopheles bellator]|uniref:uncharacterized protein LOC131212611 n=1 Tax=Anopheles bellator TaxID=139047 RepID=UPI002648CD45|nr:uncharacterized protein LOC131212611 [Anopheles bellator]
MSSKHPWKAHEELVSSPLLTEKKANTKKPQFKRHKTNQRRISRKLVGLRVTDLMIENSSDDDFQFDAENERCAEKVSLTQSQPPFISPAKVAIENGNSSDSELKLSKDDEDVTHRRPVSSASESDDCLAIDCKKNHVPHLPFVGTICKYKRQITVDSDSEQSPSPEDLRSRPHSSKNKNGSLSLYVHSRLKKRSKEAHRTKMGTFSTTQWNIEDGDSSTEEANCETYDGCTASNLFIIEDIQPSLEVNSSQLLSCPDGNAVASIHVNKPSSAERYQKSRNIVNTSSADANLFNIEELLPSPVENSSSTCISTSFYKNEMTLFEKHTKGKYRKGSPLNMLAAVLREKTSVQRVWFHEMLSGIAQPKLVTLESVERCYGRVMLHFYTTTDKDDCRRVENIVVLNSGNKQLETLEAGMKIALELDEQNLPLQISRYRIIHLGVIKLCPAILLSCNK